MVHVRHIAVGVNFIDIYHRIGLYPLAFPAIIGVEAAGVVEASGEARIRCRHAAFAAKISLQICGDDLLSIGRSRLDQARHHSGGDDCEPGK